ncbi:MAG: hypothetical protein OSA43_04575 [Pirellulales bacterium]|nr:hypothetical protein [Pirellulales bacterium]
MKTRYSILLLTFSLSVFVIIPLVTAQWPRDGLHSGWYENGRQSSEEHWKNGGLVSITIWKPDGNPCPVTKVVDGSGIVVSYHENGQQKSEVHYKDGKLDGRWLRWRSNGSRLEEGDYKKGKRHGWFNFFDEEDIWSDNQEYIEGKPQWF